MSLFCFLWIPLFYLFWRSLTGNTAAAGGIWAFLAGSAAALIQFFFGPLIDPGGFGLARWMSGCVDIVAVPAIMPLVVYSLLVGFKIISGTVDFAKFALLWLIPGAAVRAADWSSQNDPIFLVLVPVLWTTIAVGAAFFITIILNNKKFVIILVSFAMLIIPLAAVSSFWSFYSQKTVYGFLFLLAAAVPMLVSIILSCIRTSE